MTEETEPSAFAHFGTRLRSAREAAGLSLDDLIAATNIGKGYLVALEEGRFERLPSPAHAKGFLRLYAACVGIPGDEVVREFGNCYPSVHVNEAPHGRPPRKTWAGGIHWSRRWGVTALLVIMVLVSALVMELSAPQRPPTPLPGKAEEMASVPALPDKKASETAVVPISPQNPAAEALAVEPAKIQSTGVFLRIRALQECWLAIDIDGEMSHQYTLKEGDIIEWKGEREFTLDIGNPAGIKVEFNGSEHPLPLEGNRPVHLVLAAGGAR